MSAAPIDAGAAAGPSGASGVASSAASSAASSPGSGALDQASGGKGAERSSSGDLPPAQGSDTTVVDVGRDASQRVYEPRDYTFPAGGSGLDRFRESLRNPSFPLETEGVSEKSAFTPVLNHVKLTVEDVASAFYIYGAHTMNLEGAVVLVNAVAVTVFYLEFDEGSTGLFLASKLDFSILAFAVVFPLTFLMQQAYTRREGALTALATLRAVLIHISMSTLMWDFAEINTKRWKGRETLPKNFNTRVRDAHCELLHLLYHFLSLPTVSKARNQVFPVHKERLRKVHDLQNSLSQQFAVNFREMYDLVEVLKAHGLPGNEAARINQYHWFVQREFEFLKQFKYYRTPQATRSFGRVYLLVLPWFFGPYFAWVAGLGETSEANYGFALALAGFTFLVLLGLINSGRNMVSGGRRLGVHACLPLRLLAFIVLFTQEDPFMESEGTDHIHLKYEISSAIQTIQFHYECAIKVQSERESASDSTSAATAASE
ncbi:Uncharacterized protein SCF082_LOCUS9411 [Durusdinium trenchii]|uniref:Autophagy-related protein 9 n=1 Tax=Durusdinium trenchii TaxID=1381693 RepID=A0ABP0IZ08_9DINO